MEFVCEMFCELPFMLNLPSGQYHSVADGRPFEIEVLQGHLALFSAEGSILIGPPESFQLAEGTAARNHRQQRLRTILMHRTHQTMQHDRLTNPTDDQLQDEIKAKIIRHSPHAFENDQSGLAIEAERRLNELTEAEKQDFSLFVAKKLHVKQVPDKDRFLAGVNALVRLYMQRFNDYFVEELAVHQLASLSPLQGIVVRQTCDGEELHSYSIVELVPPIMRQTWINRPEADIIKFKRDLSSGTSPDAVGLLGIRSRAFLQRGANRSAIIEASAALDLSVAKKIREGLLAQGERDQEIDMLLRQTQNQRFDERAKRILKRATGRSAAQFDNSLWQRVCGHRTTHRQGVAHSDKEPDRKEAEQVVEDFLDLATRVARIVPEIKIKQLAFLKWKANGDVHGRDVDHWLEAEQELIAVQDS